MPMQSQAQRRFLHARHPKLAARFEAHTPAGAKLPERKGGTVAALRRRIASRGHHAADR